MKETNSRPTGSPSRLLAEVGELDLAAGEVEDRLVHQLDLRRVERQRVGGGVDGGRDRVEVADREDRVPRLGHQVHLGAGGHGERPLRAHDELRQVERGWLASAQPVEPVAAGPPPERREVLGDRAGVPLHDVGQPAVDPALERVGLRPPGPLGLVDRLQPGGRPVGEHDLEGAYVVDGHAVAEAAAAGGVVAGHPADRGAVAGRGVGAEQQPVGRGGPVELVLHDAHVDDRRARRRVELVDPVEVARGVEHQSRRRRSGRRGWCRRRGG